MHVFDTITGLWSKVDTIGNENQPTPRYGHSAVFYKHKMYIFGGYDNEGFCRNDLHIFDIVLSQWLPKVSLKTIPERFHHTAELQGNVLTVIGGCNNQRQVLDSVYQINLDEYDVHACPNLPTARFGHISYQIDENIHVLGGCDFKQDYQSGYSYDGKWTPIDKENNLSRLRVDCVFASAIVHHGDPLVVGGVVKNQQLTKLVQNTIYDAYLQELGESVIVILQFLRPKDLVSIILASKNWSFSHYATCKLYNIILICR
jgi:N-acetylneuraminic acid mutarotase